MQRLWAGLLFPLLVAGVEPSPPDRASVQDVLRRYLSAVNACDGTAAKAMVTQDFTVRGLNLRMAANIRLGPSLDLCDRGQPVFEVTALARILHRVTDDVITADAFFRTAGATDNEQAGRLYITFVKREAAWRIFSLRFHPYIFESPLIAIKPSQRHDPPDGGGWVTLFDGSSVEKFLDVSGAGFPHDWWRIEDGALRATAGEGGRGVRTRDTYRSFELRFEWKAGRMSNSGVKYRLFYLVGAPNGFSDGAGFEYQIADDNGDPGAVRQAAERSGSLYNQLAAQGAVLKPLGEFNESAIIVRGRHCEHWLNGVKVVEFEVESNPPESPLFIQHHATDVWFRNIRVRRLD